MTQSLSIVAYSPIIRQSIDTFHETLQTEKETYTITNSIGFDAASFTLTGPLDYLMDWFNNGLVRDIVWRTPEGGTAWNGFVNRLSLIAGGNTRTKSIEGMANRLVYLYTPLDTTQNPPKAEAQTTITKNDITSQGKYGIKTAIVSGGEATAATADDQALSELAKLVPIRIGETITVGTGKMPSLKVEMLGYAYMDNWYIYTQTANTGTDDADAIIILVLAADPNSVLSSDARYIEANTTATEKYWDGKQFGWKIIQTIAERGCETGSTGYPWACGVYEGRRTTFKQAEGLDSNDNPLSTNKHLALHRHMQDPGDSILDEAGREVLPWDLRPDRLVYTEGIPGRPMYVEQVKFIAPFKAILSGTDILNPAQNYVRGPCR